MKKSWYQEIAKSGKHCLAVALLLISCSAFAAEPVESDFYTETIHLVDTNVNLVADYGASGSDTNDDSVVLQTAIDELATLPNGGKITIPSGAFYLRGVKLKSNVHIEIDPGATLKLTSPANHGTLLSYGLGSGNSDALTVISNVSIRASSGRYTVDLTDVDPSPAVKVAFINCKNVDNFLIADFNVVENYTRLSSITFNLAKYNNQYFRPRNGVIKNGNSLYGHFGYGMIQVQCATNLLFKNLTGTGGVTLRLESGAGDVSQAPDNINIDQIYARHITITNGHYALMMGPHSRKNGHVDADGIYAVSSLMAATCGLGYPENGYSAGYFGDSSIIRNVHAVYGATGSQFKIKNMDEVPCQLRHLISTNSFPYDTAGIIYPGPSIGAARNSDPDITFTNVTQSGFVYQPKALLTGEPWEDQDASLSDLYEGCNPVPVDGVSISQTSLSLNVSKSTMISATVSPINATDTNVNWISDNPAVAIVSESGLVTAVGPGTANITARTVDWGWFDTCEVTVSGGGGGSWTLISSNDFESGWGDWVSGGADAFLTASNAVGTQCVNLQDDSLTAYMALSSPVDLTPYTRLKLEFSLYSAKLNYSHGLVIDYSDDGGSTWTSADNCLYGFEFDNGEREELAFIIDDVNRNFSSNASIRIRCNAGFDGDDLYIDNVAFSAFAQSGWGTFVSDYGLSAVATDDFDNDGQLDILEYAAGGNPTNSGDTGTPPSVTYHPDQNVSFYNLELTNGNSGISYLAEWTDNLMTGTWSSAWSSVTNNAATNPEFNEAERRIFGGDKEHLFFRLKITQP